jgi:predicted short-subunit dehydrogenase-like oxidoreductase (DUF2520 family)
MGSLYAKLFFNCPIINLANQNDMQKITFIGAGNVASHLAKALAKAGNTILEIYSRNLLNAQRLSSYIPNTVATNHLDFAKSKAEIFIVAVKDDALAEVIAHLILPPNAILAHTSGTLPLDIIQRNDVVPAVLYPLQTFSPNKEIDFQTLPFFLEAKSSEVLATIKNLVLTISPNVYEINSNQRQILHLAAVFSCNFSNFLFTISKTILEKEQQIASSPLHFGLLRPLITETVQKAFEISPENAQTGPAKRQDKGLIAKHLQLLEELLDEDEKDWKKLYQLLSEQIAFYYRQPI